MRASRCMRVRLRLTRFAPRTGPRIARLSRCCRTIRTTENRPHASGIVNQSELNWTLGEMMSSEPIRSKFRELEADEKIRLVQDLWDEIAEEVSRRPLTEAQRPLIDERLAYDEQNPEDVESWSKAKDD